MAKFYPDGIDESGLHSGVSRLAGAWVDPNRGSYTRRRPPGVVPASPATRARSARSGSPAPTPRQAESRPKTGPCSSGIGRAAGSSAAAVASGGRTSGRPPASRKFGARKLAISGTRVTITARPKLFSKGNPQPKNTPHAGLRPRVGRPSRASRRSGSPYVRFTMDNRQAVAMRPHLTIRLVCEALPLDGRR